MKLQDNFYRKMFFIAAIWNFSFAIPGLLFPEFSIKLTFGPEIDQSLILGNYYARSMYLFWWGAVLLFGIGYYLISLDINRNRAMIWMGVLGKLCFFFFFTYSYFTGRSTLLSFLGGSGDFLFTVMFIAFLFRTRPE
jgi:hypothetical protein